MHTLFIFALELGQKWVYSTEYYLFWLVQIVNRRWISICTCVILLYHHKMEQNTCKQTEWARALLSNRLWVLLAVAWSSYELKLWGGILSEGKSLLFSCSCMGMARGIPRSLRYRTFFHSPIPRGIYILSLLSSSRPSKIEKSALFQEFLTLSSLLPGTFPMGTIKIFQNIWDFTEIFWKLCKMKKMTFLIISMQI